VVLILLRRGFYEVHHWDGFSFNNLRECGVDITKERVL
jgi:hypothetical protein